MIKFTRLLPLLFSLVLLFCSALHVHAQEEFYSLNYPVSYARNSSNYVHNVDLSPCFLYTSQFPSGSGYFGISSGESVSGTFVFDHVIPDNTYLDFNSFTIDMFYDRSLLRLRWTLASGDPLSNVQYTVTPYLVINGTEYSFARFTDYDSFELVDGIRGKMGLRFYVDYKFTNSSASPVMFRDLCLDVPFISLKFLPHGTSDSVFLDQIRSTLVNIQSYFDTFQNNFYTHMSNVTGWAANIYNRILDIHNDLISNLSSWFTTLFEKMDQDQEELINGYDPDTGTSAKNEFDSSIADLESAEGNLFGQTSYDQVDYQQFNSFFSIEAVSASMLFVKNILESLFMSLGIFGIPISIGLVILVFTRIIGFQNLYGGK